MLRRVPDILASATVAASKGSNNLPEADRQPAWLCPQCMAKVCWAACYDPAQRYRNLAEFYRKAGLKEEAEFYRKALKALNPVNRSPSTRPAPATPA